MSGQADFFNLNEILMNLGAVHSPSELQGYLCGQMSLGRAFSNDEWLADALKFLDLDHVELSDEQKSELVGLCTISKAQLADPDFGFLPLLPSDESSLERRTQELGTWCQGYLLGIGVSGLPGEAELSSDVADALRDLAQISQVDLEDGDEVEENEGFWSALVEHVKVTVLTIYGELGPNGEQGPKSGEKPAPALH